MSSQKIRIKERALKRIFDFVASAFLFALLSPIFILIIVLIKLEGIIKPSCKGPVFSGETRISKGKPFRIFKFRTLKNAILKLIEKDKRSINEFTNARDRDRYLTAVGGFLVKIYFDELPQLFNVVKGDMSLVGPRPHITTQYEDDLKRGVTSAKYIKTGILGLVQASKGLPRMRETLARIAARNAPKEKVMALIDRLYFRKYLEASATEMLLYDMWIAFRCLIVVLGAKGI